MTDPTTSVREGYDRWAAVYDDDGNPLQALEGPIVRAAVASPAGLSVLDLGCGTGRHSLWLATQGAQVIGVDFSAGMMAKARTKPGAEKIKFVTHDLRQPLPFDDGTFDLVVSGLVLEHLHELAPFFAEVRRVLKPDGRAVISAMHPAMFLRGAQARFTDPLSGNVVQPGSVNHAVSEIILAAVQSDFDLTAAGEYAPSSDFAAAHPRAAKYVDWPMLVVLELTANSRR